METFPEETLHCPAEFAAYLLKLGVECTTVDILKEEGITGSTVIDVTEDDLKELNIKMGPRKKIMQIIKSHKTEVPVHTENQSTSFVDESALTVEPSNEASISVEVTCDKSEVSSGEISIRKWLQNHAQGEKLINIFDNQIYSTDDRCLLVRIIVGEIMKICGSAYPSSEFKDEISRKIVMEFPCLRSAREDARGHEQFYDKESGTGFIEYRLKTVRKNLTPSKKRRRVGVSKKVSKLKFDTTLSAEDLEEKVMWMKLTNPTDYHKTDIINALEETRPDRQNEIKDKKPSITEILEKYPRLTDYKGEMIEREFNWLYPQAEDFVRKFSYYAVRVLNYVETKKPQLLPLVSNLDDNLKALALLPELLPVANYTKKKKKQAKSVQKNFSKALPHAHLLKFVNANENFTAVMDEDAATQPYIVCSRLGVQTHGSFFVRLDKTFLEVMDNVVTAFDILFKCHYVFNVQYAEELQSFYDFVSGCIYKITVPNPSSDALNSCLMNVPINVV